MSTMSKREYTEYLNDLGDDYGGAAMIDERCPEGAKYGNWLRRNDPIAFNVGYGDKCRELEFERDQARR